MLKALRAPPFQPISPELLELSQAKEEGGAEFNPGAKALAAGVAIVTVTNPDSSTRDVTITITG